MANDVSKKITSGLIWRFGERFAAQIVSFVVSIVLARILTPDDYGVVAMVNVFISIADVLVNSGLSSALIQKKDATDDDFSTIFYCNFLLSCVIYLILFVSAPFLASFYKMEALTNVIRVFGLRLLPASFNAIQIAYVSKRMEFKKFFWSTLGGTVFSAAVGIVLALRGAGAYALVFQYITNTVIDTLILFITVRWRPKLVFHLKSAIPMIQFGFNVMGSSVIGVVFNQLNSFVIGKKYTSADLAYYDRGKNFPRIISDNISTSLQSVLFPAMANADNSESMKEIVKKATKYMSFIIFPLLMGMLATADTIVKVLLTDKWVSAVPYIQIICVEGMIGVLDSTNGLQVLKASGNSDTILKIEFIKKPVAVVLLLIGMRFGVIGIALSVPVNAIFAMIVNTYFASKITNYTLIDQFADCLPMLLMSVVMALGTIFVGKLITADVARLLIQMIAGVLIYLGLAVFTKNEQLMGLKKIVIK